MSYRGIGPQREGWLKRKAKQFEQVQTFQTDGNVYCAKCDKVVFPNGPCTCPPGPTYVVRLPIE